MGFNTLLQQALLQEDMAQGQQAFKVVKKLIKLIEGNGAENAPQGRALYGDMVSLFLALTPPSSPNRANYLKVADQSIRKVCS